jgi:hypothetical protein
MNDAEEDNADEVIRELLAPLRNVMIPAVVRDANRETIQRALSHRSRPAWWRRTVGVPLPLATAATVAIVATTIALVFQIANQQAPDGVIAQSQRDRFSINSTPTTVADGGAVGSWTITRSYIQTLQSLATSQVPADFDTKENRDES